MLALVCFTQATAWLLAALFVVAAYLTARSNKHDGEKDDLPPSPRFELPILGHLHLLGGYEVPYQAFTDLGRRYGEVVGLKLGSVDGLVVNGQKNIREVLVTKGHLFDSRPNFERYRLLFGGNKDNSLAFCDWSDKQKIRRDMLKAYTFPRAFTHKYNSLETILLDNTAAMMANLSDSITNLKPLVMRTCANVFANHFCSKNFDPDHSGFAEMIENFDEIFYEVNQGYAADFLPFLLPLHSRNLRRLETLTHKIRAFIEDSIIGDRYETFGQGGEPSDYVESLIDHVKGNAEPHLSWETALFALEDIIGGHSAVGNYIVKVLGYLVKEPEVQARMQKEIDESCWTGSGYRPVSICDRNSMPYTEAVLFEAIRLIASPIVPRVSNQDTYVGGYKVKKDTLIFLNNYDLSMNDELWTEPEKFNPERFIRMGGLVKPEHFLPFGGGRRGCMGYKMVQLTSFAVLGTILQHFNIVPLEGETYKVPVGALALPKDTFKFRLTRRSTTTR